MKKSVSCVGAAILIFFTFFAVVSCKPKAPRSKPVVAFEYMEDGEEIVLENQFLHLRFLPDTAEIILTDKASGVEWRSNPPNPAGDLYAQVVTRQLMESQFSLEYADNSGVGMTLQSGIYSVQRNAYEFEVNNNVLEVRYTVGDLSRAHRIPPAMTEERMNEFFYQMDDEEKGIIETTYRLYDINNLRSTDDRTKLLSDYPDLREIKLWVLRLNSPDFMKEMSEDAFKNAGYTLDDYISDSMLYEVTGADVKPAFSIVLRYSLEGRSLILNVPFDLIGYRSVYPIKKLTLMPFMGAGSVNDTGYMLVPDGSGAIINFNNGKQNQLHYSINVYGQDEAMPREGKAKINDNSALFPAFGIYKNGAALFCIIEEGSAYANITADVSGRNCSWNSVYPIFDMIHGTELDIVERSQRKVFMYETGLPAGENITLRYTPCAEPGYMGMAKEYRSWLLDKYPAISKKRDSKGNSVPVAVEIIGAVNKTQHRLGLPMDLPLKLTSYKETASMIDDFSMLGWDNVYVKLNGWFNRSVEHKVPSKIKLIKELGSNKDFKSIVNIAEKNNYNLYPEADFVFVRDVGGMFSGFSLYADASRYVNRERVQSYPYSFVWFGERTQWGKLNYLVRPTTSVKIINNYTKKAEDLGIKNIAFRNMASKLAGDYHEKRRISREESMRIRQRQFEKMDEAGTGILVHTGHVYAAPWASIITDMIITDQNFGITDASIPFLPIVLHGLVPYTGRAINLAEDYTKNLLKTIESGAGLYFSFMKEDTSVLQETKFRQFYANEYDKWIEDANDLYQKFNGDFGHLSNQLIVNHVVLSANVTATVYEDGTRVVVNASDNAWIYNGMNVNANSYIVLKQGSR